MIDNSILDLILHSLADTYESGKQRCVQIIPASREEYEPLRETLAALRAEGSIASIGDAYQLTSAGYTRYAERITALRVLPSM